MSNSISNERLREIADESCHSMELEAAAIATELLAARDALAALTKERDDWKCKHESREALHAAFGDSNVKLCLQVHELKERITDWRDAFALPNETDAAAIERTRAALAATEGKQP